MPSHAGAMLWLQVQRWLRPAGADAPSDRDLLAAFVAAASLLIALAYQMKAETPAIAESTLDAKPTPRPDHHGDPLPAGALARLGTVRWRLGGSLETTALSPDGTTVASHDYPSNRIHIGDMATGRQKCGIDLGEMRVRGLLFTPDGKELVLVTPDELWLLDAASGKRGRTFACPAGQLHVGALTRDSRLLACGGDEGVYLIDFATGRHLHGLEGHKISARDLTFSPDGKILASGIGGQVVFLWDVRTGKRLPFRVGHKCCIDSLAFSPDSKTLASSAGDGTIRLWNTTTGKESKSFAQPLDGQGRIAFSADGLMLAAGTKDQTNLVTLWNIASGKPTYLEGSHAAGEQVTFLGDGRLAVAGTHTPKLRIWDLAKRQEVRLLPGHLGQVNAACFTPDGKTLASAAADGSTLLWDTATWKERLRVPPLHHGLPAIALASSRDARLFISENGPIRVFDANAAREIRSIDVDATWIDAFTVSPDGRTMAVATFEKIASPPKERDARPSRVVIREGIQHQGIIRAFDTTTGARGPTFGPLKKHSYVSIAFSPDGKHLAAYCYDQATEIWETATGKRVRVLRHGGDPRKLDRLEEARPDRFARYVHTVAFSPDGQHLATDAYDDDASDAAIGLWHWPTGKRVRTFEGHRGVVTSLAFAPDGRTLASGGQDRTARLWEIATGQQRRCLTGHTDLVERVAYSPTGDTFVTASRDATLLVWPTTGRVPEDGPLDLPLPEKTLDAAWARLADADAARAYQALGTFAATPQAAAYFAARLEPMAVVPRRQIDQWIADLDSPTFTTRQTATAALEERGDLAEKALRAALDSRPSAEMRQRLQRLVDAIDKPVSEPRRLRTVRALEVLERSATPEARRLLEKLAAGAPGAWLTRDAQASLQRMGSR